MLQLQSDIEIPAPLLLPTIHILQHCLQQINSANEDSFHPISHADFQISQEQEQTVNGMIPRPKQEKVMSKKRRNKASTLTEIKNLMDECRLKYTPDLFRGITEAKHYVILLDLSYDGVPLFKDSSVNNSNAILSFYVANMTKRRCQFDHDAFIAFLIPPEDSPKKLKSSTEYTIIENNKIWGNRDDSIMHYNPNEIKVECTYEKTGSPAGGNFRDLAGMYIGQLTKKGREGFVIRLGR